MTTIAIPLSDERVAQLVRKTLETKPKGGTHWSIRQIAAETRVSKSTVHRIWQAFGLEPHRQKHFKLSTDPFFVEKVGRRQLRDPQAPASQALARGTAAIPRTLHPDLCFLAKPNRDLV